MKCFGLALADIIVSSVDGRFCMIDDVHHNFSPSDRRQTHLHCIDVIFHNCLMPASRPADTAFGSAPSSSLKAMHRQWIYHFRFCSSIEIMKSLFIIVSVAILAISGQGEYGNCPYREQSFKCRRGGGQRIYNT